MRTFSQLLSLLVYCCLCGLLQCGSLQVLADSNAGGLGDVVPPNVVLFLRVFPNGVDDHEQGVYVRITKDMFESHAHFPLLMNGALDDAHRVLQPERVVTEAGVLVKDFKDLLTVDRIYVIPKGFHFHWPGVKIGHLQETPVKLNGQPIIMETLSMVPKIFKIHNFITAEESSSLIEHSRGKVERSATGVDWRSNASKPNKLRTSDNAFDVESDIAKQVIQRSFETLRVDYLESMADGLQILRYRPGQAYTPHLDQFEIGMDKSHNFDARNGGTNRMATVFMYLNNVEEGGETVFPRSTSPLRFTAPPEGGFTDIKSLGFSATDWEVDVAEACRNLFAVPPKENSAIVFYTQRGDGSLDDASFHGGCPVLQGEKWAANMWVWNGPRFGMAKKEINVTFINHNKDRLEVFWSEESTGKEHKMRDIEPFTSGDMQTHVGHTFIVRFLDTLSGQVTIEAGRTHYKVEKADQEQILQPHKDPQHEEPQRASHDEL